MRRSALRTAVAIGLFALALAAGVLVSSQFGQRWMREEAELQLARILEADVRIDRVAVRFRYGLEIHVAEIRVEYPAYEGNALSAARVAVSFDTLRLLTGRVRIARLEVDGLQLDLRRDREGVWSPGYFPSSSELAARRTGKSEFEGATAPVRMLIETAHFLLRGQQVAEHIVLRDGVVTLLDARPRAGASATAALRLEGIHGTLDRSWLRGESDLALSATWVGAKGRPAPVEVSGRWRDTNRDLNLAIAFTGIELASLRPYLVSASRRSDLAGRVSGVIAIVTPRHDRGLVELDWSFDGLQSDLQLGSTRLHMTSPLETLNAQLSIEPRRVRLESARLQGKLAVLKLSGSAERPLGRESLATIRASLSRTELADLRRLASGLPPAEAEPLLLLLDRIRSGHITKVGVRGGTTLEQWLHLFEGRLDRLPNTLRLIADIEDVTFGTSPTDTIHDVSARVTWSGQTFEIHGLQGSYNEQPLPRTDLAVDGINRLLAGILEAERLTRQASPLPGLGTLWDIVRGEPDPDARQPRSPVHLTFDQLQHPALRWPIRNAEIEIDPTERDLHVSITRGFWAGKPIRGEAILAPGPTPELRVELVLSEEPLLDAEPGTPAEAAAELEAASSGDRTSPSDLAERERDAPWASGRFASADIEAGPIGFHQVEGAFEVRGSTLAVSDIEASLRGGGRLEGSASFALDRPDEVAIGVDFAARNAEAERVARLFGLGHGFASGRADMMGTLSGPLRPGTGLITGLVGSIAIDAHSGELQQKVPLLAAVAHAIEGWSPGAARKAIHYERIETRIDFDRGFISTEEFALEGPLRILASGSIDLNETGSPVDATIGLFLLRQADRLLGDIPLVNLFVPGSDRGLIGAYFEASGPAANPELRAMPMKSIADGLPLPPVLRQPFDALQALFAGRDTRRRKRSGDEP